MIGVLLLDALVLGVAACALGLVLGDELSIHLFRSNPGYLGSAFAVGTQRVVGWQSIAVAAGGGMLAAVVAVLSPRCATSSHAIRWRRPLPKRARWPAAQRCGRRAQERYACWAPPRSCWQDPGLALAGMVLLVAALLFVLPAALALVLALLRRIARALTGAVGHVAAMELSAARSRAVARAWRLRAR